MAHTSPEDYSAEIRHLSYLVIEEILNSIISSSSSPSSSTKPVVCDPAYSYIHVDQSIPGCNEDSVTNADRMVNGAKRLPGAKRVTFGEDVTVVCYEQTSEGEDENRETEFLTMEVDQMKESVIDKKEEDVGSERDDREDFKEKNTYADGNILKRKCIGSVLEDEFMIPTKVMKPEVDSLFGHQNENGEEAHGSHFHSDENKAKVEAHQAEVEANQLVSYPSEVDSTVQGNPTADSLCPDDDDTLPSELSSSNDDIIDDCRSVLQSIVDTTLHQTVQNTKSDENLDGTLDTSEQPPIKKIKLAPLSDLQLQTSKNSFSNSLAPGLLSKDEMESSTNNMPHLVNTSTSDVEQLPVCETINIKACSIEATVLCDNLSLDLSSEKESENGDRVLEGACDSTGVSTSTPDVMADEDVDSTIVTEPAEVSSTLLKTSNVRENHNRTSNDDLLGEVCPYTSTPDVELVEDIPNITTKDESNAYSSILVQDLYLDDSVECSEQLEVIKLEFHCNKEDGRGNSLPSSADVKVVKSEDVYVDAIEPSLREDIMPSPGSSGDDFICTFQKASQVLASSQDEMTCSHTLRKFDVLSPEDLDLMTNRDLQVPPFVSVRQETMHYVVVGDWKAFPDKDDGMLKVPEITEQGHPDISQESPSNLQYDDSKAIESPMEHSEHQFLQLLGPSPKQKINKCEEQSKSCNSCPSDALPTCKMDSEFKDIEATEENDPCIPLLHPMSGYLGRSLIENSRLNSTSNVEIAAELNRAELLYRDLECTPIEGSKMESSLNVEIAAELRRDEVKVNNDQTVPSLQTPVKDNPCIDQLLELEKSIFTEQDAKLQDGPMKQGIPVLEEAPYIEDEEDKPIPDHLQTLGQPAAGVFLWNHSLADPSLTPSLTKDQSNLQHTAENLNQTPPITPVRPLPVCQRKRRVGLSRRQLVYPLHAGKFSRK